MRQDHQQLFSGSDYQAHVRIYVDHIERCVAARLDSYKEALAEIDRPPTEGELSEIFDDFKATWEVQIKHSNQALSGFLATRNAPAGLDLAADLRAGSAHGHDRVLQEWKIWRGKVLLLKSVPNSKARTHVAKKPSEDIVIRSAFISYSWDDDAHCEWVRGLAERLRADGVDVSIDRWDAVPGDQLPAFMERAIRENQFVIIVCTPRYKKRADAREGGVGYEGDIMTAEVMTSQNQRKFIPVLRTGNWPEVAPSWLGGKYYVDLAGEPYSERAYEDLLRTLLGTRETAPPIGKLKTTIVTKALTDTLTIVISVYNEAPRLKDLAKRLKGEGLTDNYCTILCDDGSTDNSYEVMQELFNGIDSVTCIRNRFNSRKVGAILKMVEMVRTPFILTLDADSVLSEMRSGALGALMRKMTAESYSATCFRIRPIATNWLERLQAFDYSIFTDSIRRLLGVPACLVGQGVLWRTESLLSVLKVHSGQFDGDDLENTIIALDQGLEIYWERETAIILTIPKRTILGLVKQRALSWDFGLFRVLTGKRALRLRGESGAFYKNLLLMDLLGHPFKLLAVPVLLSASLFRILEGSQLYESTIWDVYLQSARTSFRYGALAIITIWVLSVANSIFCARPRLISIVKWSVFNAVYLASPFVYLMYYSLVRQAHVNVYDLMGSSVHWLGLGLLITYLWWVLVALFLLLISSLDLSAKMELIWSALLAPLYYFVLLFVCRTVGIGKYLWMRVSGRAVQPG